MLDKKDGKPKETRQKLSKLKPKEGGKTGNEPYLTLLFPKEESRS